MSIDQPNASYDVGNEIIYNSDILKSNLCDYNDSYILVRGKIVFQGAPIAQVVFKNFALFLLSAWQKLMEQQ